MLTWVVATLVAMLLVQTSVQMLTARVTHESLPVLDRASVSQELDLANGQASLPGPTEGTASVGVDADPGSSMAVTDLSITGEDTDDPDADTDTRTGPVTVAPGGQLPSGQPGTGGGAITTTVPPAPAPPPTAAPPPPPTTLATGPAQTVSAIGGSVVIQCRGDDVQLVSYHPAPGFNAHIEDWGPEEVKVRFESGDQQSEVKVTCRNGVGTAEIEDERADDRAD